MSSTIAAMALGAFAMGSGAPGSTAQASISPQELTGVVRTYHIPPGSMAAALNAFAAKNRLHIIYDLQVTESLKTLGLAGTYSVSDGLDRLLSGTKLSYRLAENSQAVSIVLAQNDAGTQSDAGAVALPAIDVAGSAGPGGGEGDPTGTGPGESGGRFTGYNAVDAVAALKMNAPILQTPVSVQVVTRETMDDQQAISIQDALVGNVPNVYQSPGSYTGAFAAVLIRGFDTGGGGGGEVYYNGLQVNGILNTDTSNVQSFQVLKGPASILFGRIEPGGAVWLDSKRPQETPYYSFQTQAGGFGTTRTTIDFTGPLTADKTWLYRLNADFSDTNQFTDFVYNKNLFIAQGISYHPIEQFKLYVEGIYQKAT